MKVTDTCFFGASLFSILLSLILQYSLDTWFELNRVFLIIIFLASFVLFNYLLCYICSKKCVKQNKTEVEKK